MRIRTSAATLLGLASICFGASAALATTAVSPDQAATAWDNSAGTRINVKDTAKDGEYVYVNWRYSTDNRLENHAGFGTFVSKPVARTGRIRACNEHSFAPDTCSRWR